MLLSFSSHLRSFKQSNAKNSKASRGFAPGPPTKLTLFKIFVTMILQFDGTEYAKSYIIILKASKMKRKIRASGRFAPEPAPTLTYQGSSGWFGHF